MTRRERAPAKVNLGLEILGRREDGFHEIRTILCAISLADELTFEDADQDEVALRGTTIDVPPDENLILSALAAMRERGAVIPPQRATVEKAIPAAAGLGGASSDAAATLRAFAAELDTADIDAGDLAASLGSDVPFFLDGPCALASGRGEVLRPLPNPAPAWAVLVTPDIDIPDKTRMMYSAIDTGWWSDGSAVERIAGALPTLPAEAPVNVFERVLVARFPEAVSARQRLIDAGVTWVALAGAGPTFYTLVPMRADADALVERLGDGLTTHVARLGAISNAQE